MVKQNFPKFKKLETFCVCTAVTLTMCSRVVLLTQTQIAAEHVQDALTALPVVPAAFTRAPLGHLGAAVTHIVRSHDGS